MVNRELICPKSIVIVGGSNNIHKPGGRLVRNLLDGNYKGEFSSDFSMNTFRLFQLLHYDLFMDRTVWEYMEALVQKIGCW